MLNDNTFGNVFVQFLFLLLFRYNTWTKQWSSVAPMNSARAWPSVAVADNRIYVMGGFDGSNRLRSVEVFNPEEDSWTFVASLNMCRAGSGATVL
jgi:N-acetylneuraminic acid mutarotase